MIKNPSKSGILLLIISSVIISGCLGAEKLDKTTTNSIGMEFVLIPAGEFKMGTHSDGFIYSNERPVHTVTFKKAYYLGKYEVTQKQWREVMGSNPSFFEGDDLPVEGVSWNDAQEFIRRLNEKEGTDKYRLPSEAEWEYAARAGTATLYSFGDNESELGNYEWYAENSGSRPPEKEDDSSAYDLDDWTSNNWNGSTHPAGQKQPNAWGLYDMHGNVMEWVQDTWHEDYSGAPLDGSAWERGDNSLRVIRGGGWFLYPMNSRAAFRDSFDPTSGTFFLGFRLLQEA